MPSRATLFGMTRIVRVPDWDIADRLKKSLRESGISAGEMAARLGVNRTTLSNWCSGKVAPDLRTIRLWSIETGVPTDWLVGDPLRLRVRGGVDAIDRFLAECAARDSNPEPADYWPVAA